MTTHFVGLIPIRDAAQQLSVSYADLIDAAVAGILTVYVAGERLESPRYVSDDDLKRFGARITRYVRLRDGRERELAGLAERGREGRP